LGPILLIAAALARLALLVIRPLWHDEVFTLWAVRSTFPRLLDLLRNDSGPPLFYVLEKPFVLLGEVLRADVLCRLLPFLAILLLFAGALSLPDKTARARLVILLAASPLLLVYAAEARAYALLALLDFAIFLLLFCARPTTGRFVAVALAVALALWTHYAAIFFVASIAVVLILRRRWTALAAVVSGGLLFLPWVPVLAVQPARAIAWMREPVGRSVFAFLPALGGAGRIPDPLGGPLPEPLLWAAGAVGVALAATLVARMPKDQTLADAIGLVALTTTLLVAVSFVRPVAFPGRSEMAVLPVWLWSVARAASQSRAARWASHALIACALAASALALAARREEPEPSGAATFVSRIAQKGDIVIGAAAFYLPARLAYDRGELAAPVVALPLDVAQHPGWFTAEAPKDSDYRAIEAALAQLAPGRRAFALLHPRFRTPRLAALLAARGVVRVMSDLPQTVVLVCTAQ
jgi:hypothetical protein